MYNLKKTMIYKSFFIKYKLKLSIFPYSFGIWIRAFDN